MYAIRKCDFVPSVGEKHGKEFGFMTETLGYVPIKRQVETFFQASGGNFYTGNDSEYDFVGEAAENPQDDPLFEVREMELSEIGHVIGNLPEGKSLESTESDAAKAAEVLDGSSESKEPEEGSPSKT